MAKKAKLSKADKLFLQAVEYYENDDYEKAFLIMEQAAKAGSTEAEYGLGLMYQKGNGVEQNYQKAAQWYNFAAEKGDTDAQFNLACIYSGEWEDNEDYEKALFWFEKALEGGDEDAKEQIKRVQQILQEYKNDGCLHKWELFKKGEHHEDNCNFFYTRDKYKCKLCDKIKSV